MQEGGREVKAGQCGDGRVVGGEGERKKGGTKCDSLRDVEELVHVRGGLAMVQPEVVEKEDEGGEGKEERHCGVRVGFVRKSL